MGTKYFTVPSSKQKRRTINRTFEMKYWSRLSTMIEREKLDNYTLETKRSISVAKKFPGVRIPEFAGENCPSFSPTKNFPQRYNKNENTDH